MQKRSEQNKRLISRSRSIDFQILQGENHESEIEVKQTQVESDGEDIDGPQKEYNGNANFGFLYMHANYS